MNTRTVVPFEKSRLSSGIKAIALIMALTAVALIADHAYFVAPHAEAYARTAATAPAPVTTQVDGFALPANLKPHAGDVEAPPPTF